MRDTIVSMKALIVGNWKMNPKSAKEATHLFAAAKEAAEKAKGVSVVVAPPAVFLRELAKSYKGKRLAFAAQDARAEEGGAHTGEVSLAQVKDAGASWVIIGHAERRAAGETDVSVGEKAAAALALRMNPIVCIGERERNESGEHFAVVRAQLLAAFAQVPAAKAGKVVIAYEPVWAIGATAAMSPSAMHEMAIFIRKALGEHYGKPVTTPILYGGAIDAGNAAAMLMEGDVAGLLVGRASADAIAFKALVRAAAAA